MGRQPRKSQRTDNPELEAPDLKLVAQLPVRFPGELALRSFNQTVAEALEQYLVQKKR